jgi:zinc protease
MTRDDLYGHYRRHYVPSNATLVVVGDVEADEVLRGADKHFAAIAPGAAAKRRRAAEPRQVGERRVLIEREGTTAYLKLAWHAPAATDAEFFPMLVLDAGLTGAKGLNLWSSFRGTPPQRKARLYQALVERGLASLVAGSLLATREPFLYSLSLTAMEGVSLNALEEAASTEIDRVRVHGLTEAEVERAKRQLRARLVFENDSVTNVAHQIGYFETVVGPGYLDAIAGAVQAVTAADVAAVAASRLAPELRTVGWFRPVERRA